MNVIASIAWVVLVKVGSALAHKVSWTAACWVFGLVGALALELTSILFSRALRLTGDWAEADDLVQEVFTAALVGWGTVGSYPREKQLAWLNRVMINKKIDRWRTGGRHGHPVAEIPDLRIAPARRALLLMTKGQVGSMS